MLKPPNRAESISTHARMTESTKDATTIFGGSKGDSHTAQGSNVRQRVTPARQFMRGAFGRHSQGDE